MRRRTYASSRERPARSAGGIHRREGPFDAEIDHREHGRRLQATILIDLEIALLEVFDERALLVGHDRVTSTKFVSARNVTAGCWFAGVEAELARAPEAEFARALAGRGRFARRGSRRLVDSNARPTKRPGSAEAENVA